MDGLEFDGLDDLVDGLESGTGRNTKIGRAHV